MSFAEVYSIVSAASRAKEPGSVMAQLVDIDMSELTFQQVAILYGIVTKDMPCLSGYLPPNKRIFAQLMQHNAIPPRRSNYER